MNPFESRLLQGVGTFEKREFIDRAEEHQVEMGEVLIRQGQTHCQLYLIVEGELGVHLESIDREPIAILGPGESVGELSILDGSCASAFVVARSACRLLTVAEEDFWALTLRSHAFAINMLVKLAERLRANNAKVSSAAARSRLFERAAMFDPLTGIYNRRWLDDSLERVHRQHLRSGSPVSLAMLDVDEFKIYNDTYGHDAGDVALTCVAKALRQNMRASDLCARYGGEEFVIVFPGVGLEVARAACERVRQAVAGLEVCSDRALPGITVSIGVAQLVAGDPMDELLRQADNAMYEAKSKGRNQVCAYAFRGAVNEQAVEVG